MFKKAFVGFILSVSGGVTPAADSPSFDCKKASTAVEKAICVDSELMQLDADLAARYKNLRSDSSKRLSKWLVLKQQQWLKVRNSCPLEGMRGCLIAHYTDRLETLEWTEELSADGDINGDGILDLVILTQKTPRSSKSFEIYLGSKSEEYKKVFESLVLVPAIEENQFAPLEAIEINDKGVLSLYFEMAYSMGSWMRETHTYRVRFEDERFHVIGHDFFSHYRNQRSSYAESWNFLSNRMFERKYSEDEELFEKKYSFNLDKKIYLDNIEDALEGDLGLGGLALTLTSQSANHPTGVDFVGEAYVGNTPSKDWRNRSLYGSDNSYAALSKVTLSRGNDGGWTVLIRNQFSFLCEVLFDEVGTPALLKKCEPSPKSDWVATPSEIPLVCTARSKEIVCNGKYMLNGSPSVMTIARKK